MTIEVNGKIQEIENQLNLDSLLNKTVQDTRGIAVALNNKVIPKTEWAKTSLKEADKILLIKATQGG